MIKIKECRHGPMLYLSNDQWVGRSINLYGEAFENQIDFMLRFVDAGDVVIDGGANMGSMTIPLAKRAARVLAFEPQEFLYYILCGNIAANNLYNVTAYMKPLDVISGRSVYFPPPSDLYDQQSHFAGISLNRDGRGQELKTVAIDSLQLDRLDFMKLDLEGNELLAMHGSAETIQKLRPIIFLEAVPPHLEDMPSALKHHNYLGYLVQTNYFNPDNYFGYETDELHNVSQDIIC